MKITIVSRLIRLGVFKNILLIRIEPIKLVTNGANLEKIKKFLIKIFLWLYKLVSSFIIRNIQKKVR